MARRPRPRHHPAVANALFYKRAWRITNEAKFIIQSFPHAEMHAVKRIRQQLIAIWDLIGRINDPFNGLETKEAMKECIRILAERLYEFEIAPPPPHNAGVKRLYTGLRGQPAFELDINDILFQRGIGARYIDIAKAMGVSARTLRNHLRRAGFPTDVLVYTDITDAQLDHIVSGFIYMHPFSGVTMIKGFLESIGVHVSRKRTNHSVKRIDPIGTLIRYP